MHGHLHKLNGNEQQKSYDFSGIVLNEYVHNSSSLGPGKKSKVVQQSKRAAENKVRQVLNQIYDSPAAPAAYAFMRV